MPEARACKECGKMFIPKGREKYCPDVHYRPCPICGTPVVAKYLSDPPGKCDACKKKKMQPVSKARAIFDISGSTIAPIKPMNSEIAKVQPVVQEIKEVYEPETVEEPKTEPEKKTPESKKKNDKSNTVIETSKIAEPEVFCETYDGKILKYIGPTLEGDHKFINNHDYKVAFTRHDNYYMITSCHDVTESKEVNCFYIASSQLSVATRFIIVEE